MISDEEQCPIVSSYAQLKASNFHHVNRAQASPTRYPAPITTYASRWVTQNLTSTHIEPVHSRTPPRVASPNPPDSPEIKYSSPSPRAVHVTPPAYVLNKTRLSPSPQRATGETPTPVTLSAKKRRTRAMLEKALKRGPSILHGHPNLNVKAMYGVEDTQSDSDDREGREPTTAATEGLGDGSPGDNESEKESKSNVVHSLQTHTPLTPCAGANDIPHQAPCGLPPLPGSLEATSSRRPPASKHHRHSLREHIRTRRRASHQPLTEHEQETGITDSSSGHGLRDRLKRGFGTSTNDDRRSSRHSSASSISMLFSRDGSPNRHSSRLKALATDHEAQRQFFRRQRTGFMMDPDATDDLKTKKTLEFQKGIQEMTRLRSFRRVD